MARYAKLVPWLSDIELLEWLRQAKDKQQYQRRVAIWLTHLRHFPAHQVANMLGVSTQAIWLWISQYNHHGPEGLKRQGRGGRRWEYMSIEQEQVLLTSLLQSAQKGQVLTARQIHGRVCKAVGKKVSLAYVYRLLHRHGWRKLGPRPRHLKADQNAQESFKKTSLRSSQKP